MGVVVCLEEDEGRPVALAVILPVKFDVSALSELREGACNNLPNVIGN